ncbi:MAG: PIN domain-containing protein [Phycisphaeraceae bacterium]|nr:PIN domain-containing protein [Phycisphaeraceae bacterium]
MSVLVDRSIWVNYFRGAGDTDTLDHLIDHGLVVINDLILAELVPYLRIQKQRQVISILSSIKKAPIVIDWGHIIDMQVKCAQQGINNVGIPDLIIAQNAIENTLDLYTLDKHFKLMSKHLPLSLY